MNYDPSDFGVTFLAAGRSKTKDQKMMMLAETEGKCWVDYHYPGVCPQKGKKYGRFGGSFTSDGTDDGFFAQLERIFHHGHIVENLQHRAHGFR